MPRAILLVLDSVGIGGAPDADRFGDSGANTLGHISERCARLSIPNLLSLGLAHSAKLACGEYPSGLVPPKKLVGLYGCASEVSSGKDTPSGHWEMAGFPVAQTWTTFPDTIPTFPSDLIASIIERSPIKDILGNKHSSGTEILSELGDEHITTGHPIFYTSSDSVIQIAAHEEKFGLDALYDLCSLVYEFSEPMNVQRVIARPFIGNSGTFTRTSHRKDYCRAPMEKTLLDYVVESGGSVYGIGKIADIFANRGITHILKGSDNSAIFARTLEAMATAQSGDLIFANFVDFDQDYGHRRDVEGYASCLEEFDSFIPDLLSNLRKDDLLILTADHGNDPTWHGTDHTRERVPILLYGEGLESRSLGVSDTFADIGATLSTHLQIPYSSYGKSLI